MSPLLEIETAAFRIMIAESIGRQKVRDNKKANRFCISHFMGTLKAFVKLCILS